MSEYVFSRQDGHLFSVRASRRERRGLCILNLMLPARLLQRLDALRGARTSKGTGWTRSRAMLPVYFHKAGDDVSKGMMC